MIRRDLRFQKPLVLQPQMALRELLLVVLHKSCDNGCYERMREKLLGEVGIAVIRENLLREGPCDVAMQKSLITSRPVFHNSVFLNPSSVATSREMCSTTRALPWAFMLLPLWGEKSA